MDYCEPCSAVQDVIFCSTTRSNNPFCYLQFPTPTDPSIHRPPPPIPSRPAPPYPAPFRNTQARSYLFKKQKCYDVSQWQALGQQIWSFHLKNLSRTARTDNGGPNRIKNIGTQWPCSSWVWRGIPGKTKIDRHNRQLTTQKEIHQHISQTNYEFARQSTLQLLT